MNTITIPKKGSLYSDIKKTSRTMGVDEKELVKRAILFYLNTIREHTALQKEFDAWDRVSDEAFSSMEKGSYEKR